MIMIYLGNYARGNNCNLHDSDSGRSYYSQIQAFVYELVQLSQNVAKIPVHWELLNARTHWKYKSF